MKRKVGPFKKIPTWDNGEWSHTTFETQEEFIEFLLPLFKEPGKYEFDETIHLWNEQANIYRENNYYIQFPKMSRDYIEYWNDQKDKCQNGVIYKNNGKTWYITREYYMWINFLPINNKETKLLDFVDIRDAQYHMALYELLAELNHKHAAIVKKRQIAASYFHCAKIINLLWFEQTPVIKMGASLKDYINEKGNWRFLIEYKSFLNEHTAWYRPMTPDKVLMWQQQIERTRDNRKFMAGLKGSVQGVTFEKDPTAGVGGPCTFFYYEEAGIAPTMHITTEFLFPAMRSGQMTTGLFAAVGSVGDLDQCEPLKDMILKPEPNDIYSVNTNLLNADGDIAETGLFIPEQWSMPPFIDKYGNSQVDEALASIRVEREKWKSNLSPEKYQYRISQHPINIEEAFAARKASKFPLHLVQAQHLRIRDKEYPYELYKFVRDPQTDKPLVERTTKAPVSTFPVDMKMEDKSGSVVIWEKPPKDPEFGMYYASIDPVSEGKTTTSESLCSIYVYKAPVETTRIGLDNMPETFVEGDKIVAAWCGRYDDINETHELLCMIIEYYNAWTLVESNISLFIQYMLTHKKQRYLVPKDQIVFLKEIKANNNVFQEYGWRNTGKMFRQHLLSYLIEYLKEKIDIETDTDGTVTRVHYGIERIPDPMAMEEMKQYHDDLNVDRLVALSALIAFARIQHSNRGYLRRTEDRRDNTTLHKSQKITKLNMSPFRNMGKSGDTTKNPMKKVRKAFKNIR